MTARMLAVALLALTVAAPAEAKKKSGHLRLKFPPAGQASLGQITSKARPGKLKLKGKLPADVGVVGGSVKVGKRWVQDIVVFRRGAAAPPATAETGGIDAQYAKAPGLRTAIHSGFLPDALPKDECRDAFLNSVFKDLQARGLDAFGPAPPKQLNGLLRAGCGQTAKSDVQNYICHYRLRGCAAGGDTGDTPGGGGTTPGGGGSTPPAFTLTGGATFTPGAGPTDIAVGNLDGNAFPDLVTSGSGGLTVFLSNAGGAFGSPNLVSTAAQQDVVGVGDFNADGKQDLLGVNSSPGAVQSFLGNGTGAFSGAPAFSFASGAPVRGLAICQLNPGIDSRSDLVLGQNDGQVALLLGQANGSFIGQDFAAGNGGALVAVGCADFNGDGIPDIVVVGAGSTPRASVLINNNNGTFGTPAGTNLIGAPTHLAVGDLNGDGKPDIAVLEGSSNVIQLFPSAGDGTFGASRDLSFTGGVRVAMGDVNGDGTPDVIGLNQGAGNVSAFLGQPGAGLPGYTDPVSASVLSSPTGMAFGDFNSDAKIDFAVLSSAPGGGIFLSGP